MWLALWGKTNWLKHTYSFTESRKNIHQRRWRPNWLLPIAMVFVRWGSDAGENG